MNKKPLPFAALSVAALSFSPANAATLVGELGILDLTANSGNNPATGAAWEAGDTYRLVFVTSTTRNTLSTAIGDYNDHAQAAANASSLGLGGASWKVFGSTSAVDARDNTGTAGGAGTGGSVFLVDGATIILNTAGNIWNSNLLAPIDRDEEFNLLSGTRNVAVGTGNGTGAANGGFAFGNEADGETRVTVGNSNATGNQFRFVFNSPSTGSYSFYALSDPLTVEAIPEPSTALLSILGALGLLRRRR